MFEGLRSIFRFWTRKDWAREKVGKNSRSASNLPKLPRKYPGYHRRPKLTIREIEQINDLCKRMNDLGKRMSDLCKRIEWDVTT